MKKILVCTNYRANHLNPSCGSKGSKAVLESLTFQLKQHRLVIDIEESPCLGFCQMGPNVRLVPNGPFFHSVSPDKIDDLLPAIKKFSA